MKILNVLCATVLFITSNVFADADTVSLPDNVKNNVLFFKKICESTPADAHSSISLILIDATDPLEPDQIQFIRDNYIKKPFWKNLGDRFTIVVLNDKPTSSMDFVTICAPVPESKIDSSMAVLTQKKQIRIFNKTLSDVFDVMVSSKNVAKNTNLIESLVEIFRSKRYGFLDAGERHLIVASDLYQNSNLISFYKLCKNNQCPTYIDTLKNKSISHFIKNEANLSMRPTDKVDVYHLKSQGRINLTAKLWWVSYFNQLGVKIRIESQL